MTSDKKVQRDLQRGGEPARRLRALRAPKKRKKSRLGRIILLGLVGAAVALILSEDARKTVLDALFGAEEEFEYTSTTRSTAPECSPRTTVACRPARLP